MATETKVDESTSITLPEAGVVEPSLDSQLDDLLAEESEEVATDVRKIASIGQEVTTAKELVNLVKSFKEGKKPEVICYDGFEPSGRMHIAQGLIRSINVNKLTSCGFKFVFWVADWFAKMNLKFGGDMKKIQKAGELMIHTWKASGMDMSKVEFIWSSESIGKKGKEYMEKVIDVATTFTINRMMKCTQIMGREESTSLKMSQLLYPAMQCVDIFHLNVDICSLGLDQRKVNMLAREYSVGKKRRFHPIIVSHPMLPGLDGSDKMSKSNPDNAIFMDDTTAEVKRKINKAYCRPGQIDVNPVLQYFKCIVFQLRESVTLNVLDFDTKKRTERVFDNFEDMEKAFAKEEIHPNDVKPVLIKLINEFLDPVREYIESNKDVKALSKQVRKFR
jgi:tyrosyl-tRNA synthetase